MKKTLLILAMLALSVIAVRADIVIGNKTYHADTLVHRQIGPGTINTIMRLPDYPLNVYVLSCDLNNPNNRIESTFGRGIVGKTERLVDAVVRNRTATKRPVAACNANFWVVGGVSGYFMQNAPMGGVVRNDTTIVNDNNTWDQWNGGAYNTGVASITRDKTLVFGRMLWSGMITADKLSQPLPFQNVNRRAVTGEICLWNRAYSPTREFEDDWVGFETRGDNQSDNYYLTFVEGDGWKVNAPMSFTVAHIINGADRQTLGENDACLSVTGDANKAAMAALAVGDTLQLVSGWRALEDNAQCEYPEVENLVTGNATIMHNGELTPRNYNEDYNTSVYSRTCYGASADGKHLYMLVIDKSVSPVYGASHGCNTAVACQILKQMCPDVSEMVNMDAGGSAEMLVMGEIINRTTEGTPRNVATGWMIEAIGDEDHEVASIAFDKHRIDVPSFSTVKPRVLGYNLIGELIDEDVQGFELTCDETLGTASGSTFIAGPDNATGVLTATLNGMTATIPVQVISAEPSLVLDPIVIDRREYLIEVAAQVLDDTYFFDPATLTWTFADDGIATVTDGVLCGEKVGTTELHGAVGSFMDTTQVIVQLVPSTYIQQGWDDWVLKGVGAKNLVLDEATGDISYTYVVNRSPSLTMTKDLTFYGLPDTVGFVFSTTLPIEYVQIDTRNRFQTKTNYVKYLPPEGAENFEPGRDYRIVLDLDALGGTEYVGTYPVNIKNIKFSISKSAEAGEHTLSMKSFYCHYPRTSLERVTGDVNSDFEVNIADVNALIDAILTGADATVSNDVNGDGEVNIADINAVINIILSK